MQNHLNQRLSNNLINKNTVFKGYANQRRVACLEEGEMTENGKSERQAGEKLSPSPEASGAMGRSLSARFPLHLQLPPASHSTCQADQWS
jgi:hypothetical protein